MIVAPTEPAALKALGTVSLLPEAFGVDVIWHAKGGGLAGVQRKEVGDLIASVRDGRLGKELAQMQRLKHRMLVVEGRVEWTTDRKLMRGWSDFTEAQWRGVMWTVQNRGCWIVATADVPDTVRCVVQWAAWLAKDRHSGLRTRGGIEKGDGGWGRPGNRDFEVHLLMGLPGVGGETAERMLDTFGVLPIKWRDGIVDGVGDLERVVGVGKKKAKKMWEALEKPTP